MFAIIQDGGRQHLVQPGQTLSVDYRADAGEGDAIAFDRVLLANGGGSSSIGQPAIADAVVNATVVAAEQKGPKLEVQKLRRRKNSRRHTGHRQKYTLIRIDAIDVPGLEIVEKEDDPQTESAPPESIQQTPPEESAAAATPPDEAS